MAAEGVIRESLPGDWGRLSELYRAAFPQEDLLSLLDALLNGTPGVISLILSHEDSVVGHIALTPCSLAESKGPAALLGPLAISPGRQRQGLGSVLLRAGLERAGQQGLTRVFVLGDPAYYGRFGFVAEPSVQPPYDLPREWEGAWQSLSLDETAPPPGRDRLSVPPAWRKEELWRP